MRKPTVPISITSASEVNVRSSCDGRETRISVPTAISAAPNRTEAESVFLQRSMFRAA